MLLDIRPVSRLRGPQAVDVAGTIAPVLDALGETGLDLTDTRLVYDWIQYRANFRSPIDLRPILRDSEPAALGQLEVAIDLRRAASLEPAAWRAAADTAIGRHTDPEHGGDVTLEPWQPTSRSVLWRFNTLYWQALDRWEKATGRAYEQALPGGESDARNVDGVRELILALFEIWDGLTARNCLPEQLYVVELGVGNGHQAKVWLDEFRAMDQARGSDYYRRLHYLMCDYSPHVLELARTTVAEHRDHVSSFTLDATEPSVVLSFLRYKVFLVYVSNVYDNLPSDEVARIGHGSYLVESQAYLPAEAVDRLGLQPAGTPYLVDRLLRLGPELLAEAMPGQFDSTDAAVELWREIWASVRLRERYVPLRGLDTYEIAPGVSGEMLRPLLESGDDVRMHVNNGAVASFVDTLQLLHPYGKLIVHDLFVTDVDAYRSGFRGPGKYEGSVVNWNNGPLLAHIGRRNGFDVTYRPFSHRTGTNIVTLTASVRD